MHDRILEAIEQLTTSRLNYDLVVEDVQSKCDHHSIVQCVYHTDGLDEYSPPLRACNACGLTEENNGAGYTVLTNKCTEIVSRTSLLKISKGTVVSVKI